MIEAPQVFVVKMAPLDMGIPIVDWTTLIIAGAAFVGGAVAREVIKDGYASLKEKLFPKPPVTPPPPQIQLTIASPPNEEIDPRIEFGPSPAEIGQAVDDAPPLHASEVLERFAGIRARWQMQYHGAQRQVGGSVQLMGYHVSSHKWITADLLELDDEMRLTKRGAVVTVEGKITFDFAGSPGLKEAKVVGIRVPDSAAFN